jgi:deoxyhypusine synthase
MTYKPQDHPQYSEKNEKLAKYETLEGWPEIKGYDFDKPFDINNFLGSFEHTGIQASNLGWAINITNEMIDKNATIFLGATSNMGSSGIRDIIAYLVKHKKIHVLVMSAGGVEEDAIKTIKPFVTGTFDAPGAALAERTIGRIGNIFAPYDRYLYFERFMQPVIEKAYAVQKERGVPMTPSEFIREMGLAIDDERSILYWAARNDIPVFCPALTDGSMGDLLTFARQRWNDFSIDIVGDSYKIFSIVLKQELTGGIFLGSGVSKHYILNANIFRDGLDYAVYLTTGQEFDASDSGGNPQEAMSWNKIKPNAPNVKVTCDASIAFPILVAGTFAKQKDDAGLASKKSDN